MAQVLPISSPVLFGESPLWDGRRNSLMFTDCFGKTINIFNPLSKAITAKEVGLEYSAEPLQFISLAIPTDSKDKFIVSLSNGEIVEFDWNLEKITKVCYKRKNPLKSYNDGKCDSKGRFWTGAATFKDLGTLSIDEDKGEIYKLQRSEGGGEYLESKTVSCGFDLPNGLAFNKEQTKLFWNDLSKRVVNVFDFDLQNGTLENRKTLFDFANYWELKGSFPDGLAANVNGDLYCACWKGASVIKIDGTTGKLLEKIDTSVTNTTSVAFGGDNFSQLFVTTTSIELSQTVVKGEPHTGKLLQITNPKDNSFKGFQEHFFNIS